MRNPKGDLESQGKLPEEVMTPRPKRWIEASQRMECGKKGSPRQREE